MKLIRELFPWKTPEEFVEDAETVCHRVGMIQPPSLPEHVLDLLVEVEEWREYVVMPLDAIRGTVHPDYAGKSWFWLLQHGKRMPHNLAMLVRNPGYYFSSEKKLPTMSYLSTGNGYFVYGDGNHRTCIAKFLRALLPERSPEFWEEWRGVIGGVEVYIRKADPAVIQAFYRLGGPEGRVMVTKKRIGRKDDRGYRMDIFELRFGVLKEKKMISGLTKEEFVEFAQGLKRKEKGLLGKLRNLLSSSLKKRKESKC